MPPLPLTQALCTKICHDLASPLNAAMLGIELIETADSHAHALMKKSLQNAQYKLKFFQMIFGHHTLENMPTWDTLHPILQALLPTESYTISWTVDDHAPPTTHPMKIRLIALLIYLSPSFLPRGGDITLAQDLTLTFAGPTLRIPPEMQCVLPPYPTCSEAPTPYTAFFHFIYECSAELQEKIAIHTDAHQCKITWVPTAEKRQDCSI